MNRRRIFQGVLIASALGFLIGGSFIRSSHSTTAMLAYASVASGVILVEYVTWRFYFTSHRWTVFGCAGAKLFAKTVILSLLLAFALEGMTIFGARGSRVLALGDWSAARFLVFFGVTYIAGVSLVFGLREHPRIVLKHLKNALLRAPIARMIVSVIGVIACSVVMGWIVSGCTSLSFVYLASFFAALFGSAAYGLAWFRSDVRRPERLFLVVALLFGSYLAFSLPAETRISWDDQTHYKQSLALSYVYGSEYSDADKLLLDPLAEDGDLGRPEVGNSLSEKDVSAYHDRLDNLYLEGPIYSVEGFATAPPESSLASYSTIGYIPSAIGLWVGRLLHLPFHITFMLGRWANLLAYVVVVFLAIKTIPIKKTLMCAIALLPTGIFMAASYSYDPWLISFCMLATAFVVRELCNPRLLMTKQRWAVLLALFFVALGPKAIYFPLIGLLFLMPVEKFASRKSRRLYFASAVALGLVVMATFIVPLLVPSGASSGDMRGGSGVDSAGQMKFIISDPLGYISILGNFLASSYLTIPSSDGYTTFAAYLGGLNQYVTFMVGLPIVVVLLIAVTESDEVSNKLCRPSIVIWSACIVLATVVLVATSMYVSFTPVGLDTINGCQPRYLIPLLFVLFALFFNVKSRYVGSLRSYQAGACVLASIPLALVCWHLVAARMLV